MSYQKKKSSFLLTALILLIIFVPIAYFVSKNPSQSQAAWWNETWTYRISFTATNNSNFNAINTPYRLTFDTASLISAGKMKSDGQDIRIVDVATGKTVRHQVEQNTLNTTTTGIWFDGTITSKNSKRFYLYYGNPAASAETFTSDIASSNSDASSVATIDGFSYTTISTSTPRVSYIYKNGVELGVRGNMSHTQGYPGNWWDDRPFTRTVMATGPMFVELKMSDTDYGVYSSYGNTVMMFKNGFVHNRTFMTYNTNGSDQLYYFLSFLQSTRNSLWVNSSNTLVDQAADSPVLYEADLGANWFGQRWTDTGNYGGNIITKNGSDWNNGSTSAQNSYYQRNYSYTRAYTTGVTQEVRYGMFAGTGTSAAMNEQASLLGLASTSFNNAVEEISPAPVAYWKFDEGTGGFANNSGNGGTDLTGTLSGSPLPVWSTGKTNKGLTFNGSSAYVAIAESTAINPTTSFSISAWINPASLANGTNYNIFAKETYATKLGYRLFLGGTGGSVNLNVLNIAICDGVNRTYLTGGNLTNINTWYHIATTFDNGNLKIYVNGSLINQTNSTVTSIVNNATGATIGRYSTGGEYFPGSIDEVKFFRTALTAEQIKADYNQSAATVIGNSNQTISGTTTSLDYCIPGDTTTCLPPVAEYRFEEGAGTTPKDTSGNNINATISNGSYTSCKIGKCVSYNGTNTTVNINPQTSLTTAGSVELWFKYDSSKSSTTYERIISTYDDSNNEFRILLDNSSPRKIYWIHKKDNVTTGYTGLSFDNNTWHHLAYVSDTVAGFSRMYLDGAIIYSTSSNVQTYNFSANWYLGSSSGTSYWFPGQIDQVRVYNYARTSAQVAWDYSLGKPIGYYKFDEGSGTKANNSGNGSNSQGTITGATWTTGKFGKALNFNNTSFVNISESAYYPTLDDSGDFTISAWIKPAAVSSAMPIVASRHSSGIDFYLNHTRLVLDMDDYASQSNATFSINNWYHVVATYKGSDGSHISKLYINGVLDKSEYNYSHTIAISELYIGYEARFGYYFNGLIDEVKIYSHVLTAEQIKADYNQSAATVIGNSNQTISGTTTSLDYCIPGDTTTCLPPVAEYRFEEGAGDTVKDSVGSNNGTWSGTGNRYQSGKIGKSGSFNNSNDYVTIPTQSPSTGITVSAWFKRSLVDPTNADAIFGGWNYNGDTQLRQGFDLRFLASTNLQWVIETTDGSTITEKSAQVNNLGAGPWYHAEATYDSTSGIAKLYVNGVLSGWSTASPGNTIVPLTAYADMRIGHSRVNSGYFAGQIDQVRIYDYARTPAQVAWDFNQGKPAGWWKLDECEGTIANDSSGFGKSGTITIGTTIPQTTVGTCQTASTAWGDGLTGRFNHSLNLDGVDDWIDVGTASQLAPKNQITFSSWFKTTSTNTMVIIRNRAYGYSLYLTGGQLRSYVYESASASIPLSPTTTYNDGTWHLATVTYDGITEKLYVDGIFKLSNTGTSTNTIYYSGNYVGFGRDANSANSYFLGQLDDIRIYNYALTSEQVKQIFANGAINFGPLTGSPE